MIEVVRNGHFYDWDILWSMGSALMSDFANRSRGGENVIQMEDKEITKLAKYIFKVVEKDLRDRRGIRHEWDAVDDEVQKEIRQTNYEKIFKVLKRNIGTI